MPGPTSATPASGCPPRAPRAPPTRARDGPPVPARSERVGGGGEGGAGERGGRGGARGWCIGCWHTPRGRDDRGGRGARAPFSRAAGSLFSFFSFFLPARVARAACPAGRGLGGRAGGLGPRGCGPPPPCRPLRGVGGGVWVGAEPSPPSRAGHQHRALPLAGHHSAVCMDKVRTILTVAARVVRNTVQIVLDHAVRVCDDRGRDRASLPSGRGQDRTLGEGRVTTSSILAAAVRFTGAAGDKNRARVWMKRNRAWGKGAD